MRSPPCSGWMRRCGARSSPSCASIWAGTASACRRRCSPSSSRPNGGSPERAAPPRPSELFAGVADGLRGALLGQAPEPNHAPALDLQAVAAHERLLAVGALHERAVGALIDQYELVAADLDARVQARDQVALDHHVVVFGPADGDARMPLIEQQLAILTAQTQPHVLLGACSDRHARNHGSPVLGLPQHLVKNDFAPLTLERGDVDLAAGRAPLR